MARYAFRTGSYSGGVFDRSKYSLKSIAACAEETPNRRIKSRRLAMPRQVKH
ncbi:hypothetical protein CDS [Bradyrhizobium sp.]|nr:hypothetical protein CDS [Bradyrhizobium sp.]